MKQWTQIIGSFGIVWRGDMRKVVRLAREGKFDLFWYGLTFKQSGIGLLVHVPKRRKK